MTRLGIKYCEDRNSKFYTDALVQF